MSTKSLDKNFGRLAVDFGLEGKVLENGILPGRSVPERSEVVTGMIHHLLNTGNWRKATSLRFGEGRHLYDQTKGDFRSDLLKAIKPENLKIEADFYRDETIDILLKHGQIDVVQELAQREDMSFDTSRYLILRAFTKEEQKQKFVDLGKRVQKKIPEEAFHLFLGAGNTEAIDGLYQHLDRDFSLGNLDLMFAMIEEVYRTNHDYDTKTSRIKTTVKKAIPLVKEDNKKIGKRLYDLVEEDGVKISAKERRKLERLTVQDLSIYDFKPRIEVGRSQESPYKNLELLWAKTHWEKEPIAAYDIFLEKNYNGKEVIPCAKKALVEMYFTERSHSPHDKSHMDLSKKHLQQIMDETSKYDYKVRAKLADLLNDKEEFLRLGKIYAGSRNNYDQEKSYNLLIQGGMPTEDPLIDNLRKQLINDDINEAAKRDWGVPSFHWHDSKDVQGVKQIYEALIKGTNGQAWPEKAFTFVQENGSPELVERARELILKSKAPLATIKFFQENGDEIGYNTALSSLAKEYDVPKDQVRQLVGNVQKPE